MPDQAAGQTDTLVYAVPDGRNLSARLLYVGEGEFRWEIHGDPAGDPGPQTWLGVKAHDYNLWFSSYTRLPPFNAVWAFDNRGPATFGSNPEDLNQYRGQRIGYIDHHGQKWHASLVRPTLTPGAPQVFNVVLVPQVASTQYSYASELAKVGRIYSSTDEWIEADPFPITKS